MTKFLSIILLIASVARSSIITTDPHADPQTAAIVAHAASFHRCIAQDLANQLINLLESIYGGGTCFTGNRDDIHALYLRAENAVKHKGEVSYSLKAILDAFKDAYTIQYDGKICPKHFNGFGPTDWLVEKRKDRVVQIETELGTFVTGKMDEEMKVSPISNESVAFPLASFLKEASDTMRAGAEGMGCPGPMMDKLKNISVEVSSKLEPITNEVGSSKSIKQSVNGLIKGSKHVKSTLRNLFGGSNRTLSKESLTSLITAFNDALELIPQCSKGLKNIARNLLIEMGKKCSAILKTMHQQIEKNLKQKYKPLYDEALRGF